MAVFFPPSPQYIQPEITQTQTKRRLEFNSIPTKEVTVSYYACFLLNPCMPFFLTRFFK